MCIRDRANDEVTTRRAYFENFIAPTYNVKFIFSEVLKDDAAVKTFIENCIDSGADAIIDFKSNSAQMARLCEENDVIYTVQGIPDMAPELMEGDFPLFTGWAGADNDHVGNPVSYTHLDVYKRQPPSTGPNCPRASGRRTAPARQKFCRRSANMQGWTITPTPIGTSCGRCTRACA